MENRDSERERSEKVEKEKGSIERRTAVLELLAADGGRNYFARALEVKRARQRNAGPLGREGKKPCERASVIKGEWHSMGQRGGERDGKKEERSGEASWNVAERRCDFRLLPCARK